ncbi:GntR family transcriptional regulator [Capsulimonas corticalis]|uniref:GntR family transcriptional regulator n=1 Tax=Capsulimonas corticalis TaxID=2219043 RepID=A0A402D027_9BACT|nr:GntR family transcriptional regulator [Capsulimonas corticalis]BDI33743.1 GntR family transcriptional regulator [Capsulimonas corticalis]
MQIHISTEDGTPIYLQIVNQIKYLAASGRLETGEEMPPIRVLAEQLLVTPNTVARAYRELEMAGVVEKRRTAGTYVSDAGSRLAHHEQWKILTQRVDVLLAEATQMNVGVEQVLELVKERSAAMRPMDDGAEKVSKEK